MRHVHTTPNPGLLRAALSIAFALTASATGNNAFACAACGCTLSKDFETQGISSTPGFTIDLSYDYLNQNRQRYGSGNASGPLINSQLAAGQEVEAYTRTQTVTASLNYTGENWGFSVQIPHVNRAHGTYGTTAPLGSSYSISSDSGIGDVRLISRYMGFSGDKSSGIIAGLKLPTGNINANFSAGTAANTPLDAGLQIGTGSTDYIVGGYTSGAISKYGWFLQGTVQHAFSSSIVGGTTYRPGNAYSLNTGIRYAEFGARISPMLQLNILKRQADTGTGVPLDPVTNVPISGGTLAYLAPGASVRVGGGMSVYGFIQLPVYESVNSLQLVPRYTFTLGVRKSLE